MGSEPYLKPRLTGPRFEAAEIPLEVLADFAALSEMLLEVAKWKFKEANPGRRRVPKGFLDGVELRVAQVESGSAIPVITLVAPSESLFAREYFDDARLAVVEAISAAESGGTICSALPERFLCYFDRFGRSLREDEAIEIEDSRKGKKGRLTRETRKALVRASRLPRVTEEGRLYGRVHEFDQRNRSFQIQLENGWIIKGIPVDETHYEAILQAHLGYRAGQRVRIDGVLVYGREGDLQSVERVESVTHMDTLDVGMRLDGLRQLKDGWFDGDGTRLSPEGLDWLEKMFERHYPEDCLIPRLFPTPDGAIRGEWQLPPWSVSVDFDLVAKQAACHALNLDSDNEDEEDIDVRTEVGWAKLADWIRGFGGMEASK